MTSKRTRVYNLLLKIYILIAGIVIILLGLVHVCVMFALKPIKGVGDK